MAVTTLDQRMLGLGTTLTDHTIVAGDIISFADSGASNVIKRDTVQGILDLAGGGAWNLIGTSEASSSASLTITGINSTYDTYGVAVSALVPATDNVDVYIRFGDSSGIDSGSNDYSYHASGGRAGASTARTAFDDTAAQIAFVLTADTIVNTTGGGFGMMAFLHGPSDSSFVTSLSGTYWYQAMDAPEGGDGGSFGASRRDVIAHDRIQVFFSSGNIASGRLSVWGLAHA